MVQLQIETQVTKKQFSEISRELKKATQKVNLFEQVLIPQGKAAIRHIKIALGDEQVAAVGRGKLAKSKRQPPKPQGQTFSGATA